MTKRKSRTRPSFSRKALIAGSTTTVPSLRVKLTSASQTALPPSRSIHTPVRAWCMEAMVPKNPDSISEIAALPTTGGRPAKRKEASSTYHRRSRDGSSRSTSAK